MRERAGSRLVSFDRRRMRIRQQDWLPYALIAPAVLLLSVIIIYPAFTALRVSLFDLHLL